MNCWKFLQGAVGLIFEGGFERIFKELLGLDVKDERMMNDGAFFKGRRGLILNWWKFFKGLWGLILNWWMVDPRAVGA
ncbi:hypothetical protein ACFX12_034366 [Malus domestica]